MPNSKYTHRSRGIYLLPNLFTTGGLMCGFYSLILAYNADFASASIAIILAALLDGLDGRVARLTQTTTLFGAEYDSMADLISFGVAPAFLAYCWHSQEWSHPHAWLVSFMFTAGAALRLARFNTQIGKKGSLRFFQGLPSPAAACTLAAFIWSSYELHWQGELFAWGLFLLCILLAIAMVSNLRFYSFKDVSDYKIPFISLLGIIVISMLIVSHPYVMLMSIGLIYMASGFLITLLRLRKTQLERRLKQKS